jgi:hypothetical protein
MLDAARIRSLPRLAAPVLTAYLDTNPATPRNQGSPPGYLAWLKARARLLDARVPESERALFREHVGRLERHPYSHPPRHRAVVAFSGASTREFLPIQVEVEDELHWGPAALKQLFWLLDEHQPSGAVVLSRSGARLLRAWLGEVAEEERETFSVDRSAWRRKDLVGPSHAGVRKRRGAQRDRFEARMKAQYGRFADPPASSAGPRDGPPAPPHAGSPRWRSPSGAAATAPNDVLEAPPHQSQSNS